MQTMESQKIKKKTNLANEFKQKCLQLIKRQPEVYLLNFFKADTLLFNVKTFKTDDVPFLGAMLSLPLKKIVIVQEQLEEKKAKKVSFDSKTTMVKSFTETYKFKEFLLMVSAACLSKDNPNPTLQALELDNFALQSSYIKALCRGLQETTTLKSLSITRCLLEDEHLEAIKGSLCRNISLNSLNLSGNKLTNGGMLGKILSEHSQRRTEIEWIYGIRNTKPSFNVSFMGINELQIQKNCLNNRSIDDLVAFLKDDKWTRSIDLSDNHIEEDGIKELALMLKVNQSLMSMDLRGNPGLSKQLSKYIFQKLSSNLKSFKNKQNSSNRQSQGQSSIKFSMGEFHSQPPSITIQNNLQSKENPKYESTKRELGSSIKVHKLSSSKQVALQKDQSFRKFPAKNPKETAKLSKQLSSVLTKSSDRQTELLSHSALLNMNSAALSTLKRQQGSGVGSYSFKAAELQYFSNRPENEVNQRGTTVSTNSIQNNSAEKKWVSDQIRKKKCVQVLKRQKNSAAKQTKKSLRKDGNQGPSEDALGSAEKSCSPPLNSLTLNLDQDEQMKTEHKQSSECAKCQAHHLKFLQSEKRCLELELELRKLKQLIARNLQTSGIPPPLAMPSSRQNQILNNSSLNHQNSSSTKPWQENVEEDDNMLQKMEVIMLELTKIMESVERQQIDSQAETHTENTIENAFSHINSLSNTIPLYDRSRKIDELQQEISNDQELNIRHLQDNLTNSVEENQESGDC